MKINTIIYIILVFIFASCTKVIEVDLNDADPKIVVDAYVKSFEHDWQGQQLYAIITMTSSIYDDTELDTINNLNVYGINDAGKRFKLEQYTGSSEYRVFVLPDDISNNWKFETSIDGNDISAETTIPNYVGIDSIVAAKLPFGPPKEGLTPICFFTDLPGESNYYRLRLTVNGIHMNGLYITRDDGFDGKQIAYPFMRITVQKGDNIGVELLSIDEFSLDYYKVFAQNTGGGGFSAAPGNPLSNIKGEDVIGIFTGQTSSRVWRKLE